MMDTEPTVFVIDDDTQMRESLAWLIEQQGGRVETFASARRFLEAYEPGRPGCVVVDVRLPGMSGLELQDQLAAHNISIPIIVITGYADVPTAIRAMKGGAIDFIEKPFRDEKLAECIKNAIALDAERHEERAKWELIAARVQRLTPREREVMGLVVAGKANKQIAVELRRSEKTIEIHRAHVMKKMEADSLASLVRMAEGYERGARLSSPRSRASRIRLDRILDVRRR